MKARVSSMTGFARVAGEAEWGSWAWEAKSVNGRSLDVRVNTPSGFETLDQHMKRAAKQHFTRGNLQLGLRIEISGGTETLSVNETALQALVKAYEAQSGRSVSDSDALATLMGVKGVVEAGSQSTRDIAADENTVGMLQAAGDALLSELAGARNAEGEALARLLESHLNDMDAAVARAEGLAASQPRLLKARLEKQLIELEADSSVDADRMAAEIALSAAKADVREELDRLRAHIATALELLAQGGAIGRKFDFLTQEFNREANTLCSKSASLDLTNEGLALKGLVDQVKEQAANVE
ncbi:YicC/YloC family endoribonuclease [Henriciella sp.]|uniref:YicC/YloC family endoribonuclease n=1 Tax=Henriciella sp. TaxID=1968823 RepID=UPI0026181F02|nr:YicC/YloC family endoribonuclease [Henriciella sp.]